VPRPNVVLFDVRVGFQGHVKLRIFLRPDGIGYSRARFSSIRIKVKGSGQECPLHTPNED
jgi:hypothetical protein